MQTSLTRKHRQEDNVISVTSHHWGRDGICRITGVGLGTRDYAGVMAQDSIFPPLSAYEVIRYDYGNITAYNRVKSVVEDQGGVLAPKVQDRKSASQPKPAMSA